MLKTDFDTSRFNDSEEIIYTEIVLSAQIDAPVSQGNLSWKVYGEINEKRKRQIRQFIHTMRVDYGLPIISSRKGYWYARNADELEQFCKELESKARSATKSYFETFRAMEQCIPERKLNLFPEFNTDK